MAGDLDGLHQNTAIHNGTEMLEVIASKAQDVLWPTPSRWLTERSGRDQS